MVRITGIVALGAALIVVAWLLAAATSASAFATVDGLLDSFIGDVILLGATWSIFYHMLGRLRHVLWDFGYCLEVSVSEKLAIGMFALATILTALVALVIC